MTNWDNQEKKEGSPSISYEEDGVTYEDERYNYAGELAENWQNQTKN